MTYCWYKWAQHIKHTPNTWQIMCYGGALGFFREEEKRKRGSGQTQSLLPTENIKRAKICNGLWNSNLTSLCTTSRAPEQPNVAQIEPVPSCQLHVTMPRRQHRDQRGAMAERYTQPPPASPRWGTGKAPASFRAGFCPFAPAREVGLHQHQGLVKQGNNVSAD